MSQLPDLSKTASGEFTKALPVEQAANEELQQIHTKLLQQLGPHWNIHGLVTLKRQALMKLLYLNHLYEKIVSIPGIICEFGVQWGGTLAQLVNLRGMNEPYNYGRRICGFDTFEGFVSVDERDGNLLSPRDFAVAPRFEETLDRILTIHEMFSPLSHIKKFELVKGDVTETFPKWLNSNPQTIIALAIFDMDVYQPTKSVLSMIVPRLTRGSLLVFDELNAPQYPGETLSLLETLGLNSVSLRRYLHSPYAAYLVWGD